jgi:hypothetical protein
MNAPACTTCGQLLRWIPESNGWGCDRCRQFFPVNAAPPPPPPAYPPPPPPGAPAGYGAPGYGAPVGAAPRPARGGSKTPIIIAIAVLVLAGGGVAAFLLLRGGDDVGAGSADAVIKSTLAAVAKGDVDAVVKLSDPKGMVARGLECEGEALEDNDMDPEKQERKLRREYGDGIENAKGMKIELVSSKQAEGEDDDVLKKGKEVEDGCKAKMDLRVVTYELELKLEDADGNKGEQTTEIRMLDIGGRYFLISPPEIKIGPNYKKIVGELEGFRDKMCACKDMACTTKVNDEFTAWGKRMSDETKDEKPDSELMDKLMPVMEAYSECSQKVMSADMPSPAPPAPPTPPADIVPPAPSGGPVTLAEAPADMPASCKDLRAMIAKLAACSGYYGKDGVTQTWAAIVDTWNKLPADSRTGMGNACQASVDAFKQAAPSECL